MDKVKYGVQYTLSIEKAIDMVRKGDNIELSKSEKHERVCYVVPEENTNQRMEFSLKPDSNAEFTSSVLVAYAKAAYRLNKELL